MIKEYFLKVASFGPIGDSVFGNVIASALAMPVIYFLNFIGERTPEMFLVLAILILLLSFFSILFSHKDNEHKIVINYFVGTLIAFNGLSFNFKQALIGLVLFHVFSFALPRLAFPNAINAEGQSSSSIFKIIISSLSAGLMVNVFLRFAFWMVK